jgi:hypothetical protein
MNDKLITEVITLIVKLITDGFIFNNFFAIDNLGNTPQKNLSMVVKKIQ